ncbi:unnamed protein product, partial [Tetraodon nigroviridis]
MFSLLVATIVATETENSNDMNVENNLTAETEGEQTTNGSETITIQSTLGDEDEDVHKCGRCQTEFSTLEAFIQHKLQQGCRRVEAPEASGQDGSQVVIAATANGTSFIDLKDSNSASSDKRAKTLTDKSSGLLGRGHRKKITSQKVSEQTDGSDSSVSDNAADDKHLYKVNQEGRYICQLCQKTFKTINILRTHLKTHSDQKNFSCDLCGISFHTKGSLVRHNRRHTGTVTTPKLNSYLYTHIFHLMTFCILSLTDERPYRCTLCGQSFRESGALTRHLKAITPCTEKIRFAHYKEILVSKDGIQKGVGEDDAAAAAAAVTEQQEVVVVEQESEEQVVEAQTAVVSVVEADSQEVLHQVHFTMEVDGTTQEQQAILNSGIALGTEEAVVEETSETAEVMNEEDSECPDDDENIAEVQVKEEILELGTAKEEAVDGDDRPSLKLHTCPHCNRSFKGLNYFRCHVKSHLGYKPFRCTVCEKEFLTGYLLKKHMEIHVSERRYKCGECGKLYKTIGHVREHMRAHSDERPYHCDRCNKGYKTKNALQVHQRTHGDEKPYVCQYCMKGFREKGSLVRHVRHHTGEKPFKCPKCGRAFAEHGTLNRHMRAKGGCQKDDSNLDEASVTEEQASVETLTTETIISDDPHAVLVEFSSVQEVVVVEQESEEQVVEAQTAVVSVVEADSQEVLHQVHFTMEVDVSGGSPSCSRSGRRQLICQAILNSGIALGTEEAVVEETSETAEVMNEEDSECPDDDENIAEVQVKEEILELGTAKEEAVDGDDRPSLKLHTCPHCNRSFKGLNYFRCHVKSHLGYKPFRCTVCEKEFLTGYLLKKHMEIHVSRGGGCQKDDSNLDEASVTEEQASVETLTTETIISDDPHAVLVEFSSVVADTQEYIIKTQTAEDMGEQEVTLIQDSQNEMGNHIMKVVQRIVSQARGANGIGSRQIIVRNTAMDEEGASISDCGDTITIRTPERLTEQVAMTLASAIDNGTLLTTAGALDASVGTVTMVTSEEAAQEEIQLVQQQEEYVITSPEEVEIQTVIV